MPGRRVTCPPGLSHVNQGEQDTGVCQGLLGSQSLLSGWWELRVGVLGALLKTRGRG